MILALRLMLAIILAPSTSCESVAHIGDSTSLGIMLVEPSERLDAQYWRVGVERVVIESAGGRSLREHREGRENGLQVARRLRASGHRGCWVVALGTNDAATVARGGGGVAAMTSRVEALMAVIGVDPVLWVDAATAGARGWYSDMGPWNEALERALAVYPNARVYRWSADARPGWFQRDGIHYTRAGSAARARLIADALVEAFPGMPAPGSG